MGSTSGIKHYKTKNDYLQKRPSEAISKAKDLVNGSSAKLPEDKVDISKEAKGVKEKVKNQIKEDGKTLKKAGSHLLADAAGAALKALPAPFKLPSISISSSGKAASVAELKESMPINKPGIFFISGLHLGSISKDDGGMEQLAKAVNGEHFSWQDEDKVFELIKRRPKEQPIVLVGHSLGGDAVVNLANRLNSLEGGFKKVNLAVTLDSVGFDNDIIPQNVSKNLNFISDDDYFFNDGPNIARDSKYTDVINTLKSAKHTEIDEDNDVHFDIVTNIHEVIGEHRYQKKAEKLAELYESFKSATKSN